MDNAIYCKTGVRVCMNQLCELICGNEVSCGVVCDQPIVTTNKLITLCFLSKAYRQKKRDRKKD
jgi:hypothetical protein